MPAYKVSSLSKGDSTKNAQVFSVNYYYQSQSYKPITKGRLAFIKNVGFELTMWCFEDKPRAIFYNPNNPTSTDSCMAGFINFYPQQPSLGYLSIEMNANGAALCSFGQGRHTRGLVLDRSLPHPEVEVEFKTIDSKAVWSVKTLLRLSLIEELYGKSDFCPQHKITANFYKCGDHCEFPHWGACFPINRLDFHSPECFGELVIVAD